MATQIVRRPAKRKKKAAAFPETRCITVDATPDECYRVWRDLEGLPRFLSVVERVRTHGDARSHWVERKPDGEIEEWDVELVEDRPGEVIAWRSVSETDVDSAGVVRFEKASGGRGTVVRLGLAHPSRVSALRPKAKLAEKAEAKRELHRFKQWIETGEVATNRTQPPRARGAGEGDRS